MATLVPGSLTVLILHAVLSRIVAAGSDDPGYTNLYGNQPFPVTQKVLNARVKGIKDELAKSEAEYKKAAQRDVTPDDQASYDFIVVGGGTAGAVVASRLSEIEDWTVLLIEAGSEETPLMDIPLETINSRKNNVQEYVTDPTDRYCLSMKQRSCRVLKARVMGGSTVTNMMVATRGHYNDYDEWERLGNKGWSYDDVLPYFRKLENMQIPRLQLDRTYHRKRGPMSISYAPFQTPIAKAFLKGTEELGHPQVDYNGRDMIGFSRVQATMRNGTRVSSNRAYLYNKRRENLFVTKESLVQKVLIDQETKKTLGVRFKKEDRLITVYANKEVILCAGAIGSAQLLLLSGVGPTADLRKLGIRIIQDLPVGYSLQDHVAYAGLTYVIKEPVGILFSDIDDLLNPYAADYYTKRKGPFTIPGGVEAIGFVNVDDPYNTQALPNIEYLFLPITIFNMREAMHNLGLKNDLLYEFDDIKRNYTYSILTMLAKPKSRGRLKLRANDINVPPSIDPNYLAALEDIRILGEGIERAIAFGKTMAMQRFGAKLYDVPLPDCAEYTINSKAYLHCAVNHMTLSMGHFTGTCKMGPERDYTAVVNPQLQVYGITGLRVIDGSIMPEIPSGHLSLPTLMIAEKGADMIKTHWGYRIAPLV